MGGVIPTPPRGPASHKIGGARGDSRQVFTFTVYAAGPSERDEPKRPLGHVSVRPGLVAPGQVAAVRTPDGLLRLRRIYYFRDEGGHEFVRLESIAPGKVALHHSLGDVTVEGALICVCGVDEECGCGGEFSAAEEGK